MSICENPLVVSVPRSTNCRHCTVNLCWTSNVGLPCLCFLFRMTILPNYCTKASRLISEVLLEILRLAFGDSTPASRCAAILQHKLFHRLKARLFGRGDGSVMGLCNVDRCTDFRVRSRLNIHFGCSRSTGNCDRRRCSSLLYCL